MRKLLVAALLLLVPSLASAQDLKDRFNVKISLSGMFLTEQQSGLMLNKQEIDGYSLAYADLRLQLDGRRLPGKFELHIDGRVRVTGELDQAQLDTANAAGYTSRGYLGGREYELRSAYVLRRGESADFAVGRFFVLEADVMKLDGIRFWYRFKKPHWDFSMFAGGYPNPYSRSLTTDYQGLNGYYGTPIGAGADTSYVYDKYWGSLGVAVIYLGGRNDGGPLDPMNVAPNYANSPPRSFLNWVGYERFVSWLDVYHNLVLDFSGPGGFQLTRLNVMATVRAGKHFTIRAGFDHMGAVAIDMFLNGILTDRGFLAMNGVGNGMLLPSITNNLVVERTAQEQARVEFDAHWGLFNVFADGRLRLRSLMNLGYDQQWISMGNLVTTPGANVAGDATIGVRDLGTLKKLRLGLWYTFLDDYRSLSYIVGFNLGRDFFEGRFGFDIQFLYAKTRDNGANGAFAMTPMTCQSPVTTIAAIDQTCYGTKDGNEYEAGITFNGNPWKHWFMFADYRLVANDAADALNPKGAPIILTHQLLLRIEARY